MEVEGELGRSRARRLSRDSKNIKLFHLWLLTIREKERS